MAKHQRRVQRRLKARQESVPSSGWYKDGTGKNIYMFKPGSQNLKK